MLRTMQRPMQLRTSARSRRSVERSGVATDGSGGKKLDGRPRQQGAGERGGAGGSYGQSSSNVIATIPAGARSVQHAISQLHFCGRPVCRARKAGRRAVGNGQWHGAVSRRGRGQHWQAARA